MNKKYNRVYELILKLEERLLQHESTEVPEDAFLALVEASVALDQESRNERDSVESSSL